MMDVNGNAFGTCSDSYDYWPSCVASVVSPILSFSIDNGTAEADFVGGINDHKLVLSTDISASIGAYCPGFTGKINLYHNDQAQQSWDINQDTMSDFFGSGVSQTYNHTVDFDDGNWCVDFSMTAVASKKIEAAITDTSSRVC